MTASERHAVLVFDGSAAAGLSERYAVGAGESLRMSVIVLPGARVDIPLRVDITGPGAEVLLSGLYVSDGADRVRLETEVRHLSGGSVSRQLFKGIAAGNATVEFYGRILVAEDAQRTEAYQESHNLLVGETARVETRPQLEIYADDVKCSHGATVGQMDAGALFYMRSRGIPEEEARRLRMESFLAPVLATLPDGDRKRLQERVSVSLGRILRQVTAL